MASLLSNSGSAACAAAMLPRRWRERDEEVVIPVARRACTLLMRAEEIACVNVVTLKPSSRNGALDDVVARDHAAHHLYLKSASVIAAPCAASQRVIGGMTYLFRATTYRYLSKAWHVFSYVSLAQLTHR